MLLNLFINWWEQKLPNICFKYIRTNAICYQVVICFNWWEQMLPNICFVLLHALWFETATIICNCDCTSYIYAFMYVYMRLLSSWHDLLSTGQFCFAYCSMDAFWFLLLVHDICFGCLLYIWNWFICMVDMV